MNALKERDEVLAKKNDFKGIIESIYIYQFRKIKEQEFTLGKKVTAIIGQNGTMKTTILGMIGQPFSMRDKNNPISDAKTIDGLKFESKLSDKFKFSTSWDKPGEHKWRLNFVDKNCTEDGYFEVISIARKEKDKPATIRFWSAKGREKGDGYVQYPVIYLSLKRLSPVGEDKQIKIEDNLLEKDELEFYKNYHNKILILEEKILDVQYIKSTNKKSLGPKTKQYDANTISAGQDNIGKILLAILSFKRLKDKYGEAYKGGILLIDELDATLYPAAQVQLVKELFRFASDYNIQIIFTTHSLPVIKTISQDKYRYDSEIVFLRDKGGSVVCEKNLSIEQIIAKLDVEPIRKQKKNPKIRMYCEDEEARLFFKALIPYKYHKLVHFVKAKIGGDELQALVKDRKIPEFTHSLIVLDGDKSSRSKNILILPGENPPDKLMYDYLKNLPEESNFWEGYENVGKYDKQYCFKNFPNINNNNTNARSEYKKWFNEQKEFWGKGCKKLFNQWINDNKELERMFNDAFIKAYNYLAKKNNIPTI